MRFRQTDGQAGGQCCKLIRDLLAFLITNTRVLSSLAFSPRLSPRLQRFAPPSIRAHTGGKKAKQKKNSSCSREPWPTGTRAALHSRQSPPSAFRLPSSRSAVAHFWLLGFYRRSTDEADDGESQTVRLRGVGGHGGKRQTVGRMYQTQMQGRRRRFWEGSCSICSWLSFYSDDPFIPSISALSIGVSA